MKIKNWQKFQHFKDRTPPWVKLYRDILDDPDWHELDGDAAKTLTMLWLIASEDESHQGTLPDVRKLSFRLRINETKLKQTLTKLSHWLEQDDINMISTRCQHDAPETETETETERDTESLFASPNAKTYSPKNHLVESGASPDLVDDWLKVRKAKKAVNSERAIKAFLAQVLLSGKTIDECLTICVEKSWKGFDATWVTTVAAPVKEESFIERMNRMVREGSHLNKEEAA